MSRAEPILRIAVPSPLYTCLDYLPPRNDPAPAPGTRVRVPLGRGRSVGIVVATSARSEVAPERLRRATAVLDETPLLAEDVFALVRWAADYYHHPVGEAFATALPGPLRRGEPARHRRQQRWRLTERGRAVDPASLTRAPRQAALLERLAAAPEGLTPEAIRSRPGSWDAALRALRDKGWAEAVSVADQPAESVSPDDRDRPPDPSEAQRRAVDTIRAALDGFGCFLLDGVTGSGKTEVYLRTAERVLARGGQALVLVPEIGLTPQLVERFRRRFGVPMAIFHSGLTDRERLTAWLRARDGSARIVIGTRSAVFVPLARPGLIVVDEEHDASFKQQEGMRYSARDLAVLRAQRLGIPAVLGSATPSLESLANAEAGRYTRLTLPRRVGAAEPPPPRLLDVRSVRMREGLSPALVSRIGEHLDAGGQVLLFLNRRGFAPTVRCHDCGWMAQCRRCDARLTLHRYGDQGRAERLVCHHCGARAAVPTVCADCLGSNLQTLGQGTQRIADALRERFPDQSMARIDRDTTQRKGAMANLLDDARAGRTRILLGTQMLAKGHHFPEVTLAAILDADQGLFSADFRAAERMAQLIVQVSGRAGRADRPGEVVIQTHHPDHPLLQRLIREGYAAFAAEALAERRAAALPPYASMALVRAESPHARPPLEFLEAARELAEPKAGERTAVLGPIPAPMERRAGRYRAQLLVHAPDRSRLHALLGPWIPALAEHPLARRVRWSIDVDPADMH